MKLNDNEKELEEVISFKCQLEEDRKLEKYCDYESCIIQHLIVHHHIDQYTLTFKDKN